MEESKKDLEKRYIMGDGKIWVLIDLPHIPESFDIPNLERKKKTFEVEQTFTFPKELEAYYELCRKHPDFTIKKVTPQTFNVLQTIVYTKTEETYWFTLNVYCQVLELIGKCRVFSTRLKQAGIIGEDEEWSLSILDSGYALQFHRRFGK